jgi:predicted O-methyltransferase YrrM
MHRFFRCLSAKLNAIVKRPARVESALRSLVDLQARALDVAQRQSELLGELIDSAQARERRLFPAQGELGWNDPRLPASLFRARCLEAQADTLQLIREEMPTAVCELDHRAFLLSAVARAPAEGDILEFGVFSGTTLRWMAEAYPARRFVGFDSFRGLPGEWMGYKTFNFDRAGAPPELPGNVELAIGDFAQTLPAFAGGAPRIAMAHIDCDLYESARAALDALGPHLEPGAILVFDEYFNYPGSRAHEYRACAEFLAQTRRRIDWLVYSGERAMGRLV